MLVKILLLSSRGIRLLLLEILSMATVWLGGLTTSTAAAVPMMVALVVVGVDLLLLLVLWRLGVERSRGICGERDKLMGIGGEAWSTVQQCGIGRAQMQSCKKTKRL